MNSITEGALLTGSASAGFPLPAGVCLAVLQIRPLIFGECRRNLCFDHKRGTHISLGEGYSGSSAISVENQKLLLC